MIRVATLLLGNDVDAEVLVIHIGVSVVVRRKVLVVVVAAASTSVTEVWLQCIRVAPGIIGEMRGAR